MKEAAVKNAADAKQVRNASRKERDKQRQHAADLRDICGTVSGMRVLWSILEHCGVYESSIFDPERTHTTAFREGQRAVGLKLMAELVEADPTIYTTMISEFSNVGRESDADNG